MKTPEELGLYNDLPPDATVDGFTEDPANPGWAEVSFSDGRKATLPVDAAQSLPQTPQAPLDPYGVPQGPPAPAALPEEQAAAATAPDAPAFQNTPGFAPVGAVDPSAQPGVVPAGPNVVRGDSFRPEGTLPTTTLRPGDVADVGTGAARHDPMSDIVSEGSAGGMAPFSEGASQSSTSTTTVDDPSVMQGRLTAAQEDAAKAARLKDMMAYRGRADALDTELDARDAQEAEARRQLRQHELETGEHERFIKAMEATPIDEDGFWSESPGRQGAAWVALALSGFLQGATRGQNPALNQMVQALNHSQDRWVQNQQRNRESVLSRREKLMGNAANARDSVKMQLSGIVNKKIELEAQRAGLPVPQGLETYRAEQSMKVAEAQNAIGSRIAEQATRQATEEARATAATGPIRRGDRVLQHLGVDKKAHADAMDPKGLNLGGVVGGASRLDAVEQALAAVAAKHGGSLPPQETISWTSIGLPGWAARNRIGDGRDEVTVKQLLEEAKLAYKQTVNIKSIDSENEGKNFNAIMDTGEGASTLEAVRTRAQIAKENAISVASGVTRDPQAYIDFVRGQQLNNPGIRSGSSPNDVGVTVRKPGAGQEAGAVSETTGGGPAQSAPLAGATSQAAGSYSASRLPTTPEYPSAKVSGATATPSRPGTYIRLKDRPPRVPR